MDNRISARSHQPLTDVARQSQTRGNTTGRAGGENRTSGARQTSGVNEARERNIGELTELLRKSFPGGDDMAELIHSRATELHEMGYDRDRTQAVIQKGLKMDRITSAAAGAITTLSFAVSAFPAEAVSKGATTLFGSPAGALSSDIIGGVMGGGGAMVLKAYSDKVLANAVKDSKWMEADKDMLEPAMQQMVEHREGLGQSMKQALTGGLGFDARNLVTGIAATLGANLPESERLKLNTAMSTILTPAAGALSGVLTNGASSLHGPEFLFGRTDWRERFEQLDNTTVSGQMFEGSKKRLQTTLVDSLASPRQLTKGLTNLISGPMVAEMMTLGSGLGGVNALRHVARDGMKDSNLNPFSRQALEQTVNLIAAGTAYALQGVAGTMAGPPSSRNDDVIDAFFNNHPNLEPANWVSGRQNAAITSGEESVTTQPGLQPTPQHQLAGNDGATIASQQEVTNPPTDAPRPASIHSQPPEVTDQTQTIPLSDLARRNSLRPQQSVAPAESSTAATETETPAPLTRPVRPQSQQSDNVSKPSTTPSRASSVYEDAVEQQPPETEPTSRTPPAESSAFRAAIARAGSSNELTALQMEKKLKAPEGAS